MPEDSSQRPESQEAASSASGDSPSGGPYRRRQGVVLSRRRRWLFRILAVTIVPLLLLGLLEGGLRLVGYGRPTTAVIKKETVDGEYYIPNMKFGWRFFPRDVARNAFFVRYKVDKPEGKTRILVLGGSAAQGDPQYPFAFSRILEPMLRHRYPDADFEVINLAITATNSHVVRETADQVMEHDPDLVIVYLGNNEVVGPFGAGNPLIPFSDSSIYIRSKLWAASTKIGQLIEDVSHRVSQSGDNSPRMWKGMEEFLKNQLRQDDEKLAGVYSHFESNLEHVVSKAQSSGVPLVLSTVGVNFRDNAPFGSLHRAGLSKDKKSQWDALMQTGILLQEAFQHAQAVEKYLAALEIDDQYAEIHYRLGKCYWVMQDYEAARKSFLKARDLDTLRFRADSRLNEIIREVASRHSDSDVGLIDSEQILTDAAEHSIPGHQLFCDHVHMNFHGNYVLARAFSEQLGPHLPKAVREGRIVEPPMDEATAGKWIARTIYTQYLFEEELLRRFKRPPFEGQCDLKEQAERHRRQFVALNKQLRAQTSEEGVADYRFALEKSPDDPVIQELYGLYLLNSRSDWAPAAAELIRVVEMGNEHFGLYPYIAWALLQSGDIDKAATWAEKGQEKKADFHYTQYVLGHVRVAQDRIEDAIKHLELSTQLEPRADPYIRFLAMVLAAERRFDEAESYYREALELNSEDQETLQGLAWLLATCPRDEIREPKEAVELADQANRSSNRKLSLAVTLDTLAAAYAADGKFEKATETARKALAAIKSPASNLAKAIEQRLSLYQAKKVYVDNQPASKN